MLVVDRLISRVSPEAALRRSLRLTEKGRHPEAFALSRWLPRLVSRMHEYRVARCYSQGVRRTAEPFGGARWWNAPPAMAQWKPRSC